MDFERSPLVSLQIGVVMIALTVVALRAPVSGTILIVPIFAADRGIAIRAAVATGAALIGSGPIRGSFVVNGDRARIAARLGRTTMLFAAPPAGCGAPA